MKHWKHSNRTAFAPFFSVVVALEQTVSCEITKIYASCLSKLELSLRSERKNLRIATCRNGSWTPPISYYALCSWAM